MIVYDAKNPNRSPDPVQATPVAIHVSQLPSRENRDAMLCVEDTKMNLIEVYMRQALGGCRLTVDMNGELVISFWDWTEAGGCRAMPAIVTFHLPDGYEYLWRPSSPELTLEIDGEIFDYPVRKAWIDKRSRRQTAA